MKIKLSTTQKEELIQQYADRFAAETLVAKDFVPEYAEVDLYCVKEERFGSFSKYVTVGVTADEKFNSEFYVMTDGVLDVEKEKILINGKNSALKRAEFCFYMKYYVEKCRNIWYNSLITIKKRLLRW